MYESFETAMCPALWDTGSDVEWNEAENFIYADGTLCRTEGGVGRGVHAAGRGLENFTVKTEEWLDAGNRL